jgi:polyphosphate kinase
MSKWDYSYTQNRELSWLKFNDRVLEEAEDDSVPLLERLKFISIFTSNLDEFYMIRCGSLYDLSINDDGYLDNKTGLNAKDQLDAIFDRTKFLYKHRDDIFKSLSFLLKEENICDLDCDDLTKNENKSIGKYFYNYIFPVISPIIIDNQHPFPHLINKSLYVMLLLKNKDEILYGIIPIPSNLPKIFYFPNNEMRYILIEKIIFEYADKFFPNYKVEFKTILSVTRNTDISLVNSQIEEEENYIMYMNRILKKRTSLAPIRLEFYKYSDIKLIKFLCNQLNIQLNQVNISNTPLDMSYVFELYDHVREVNKLIFNRLSFNPFFPKIPNSVKEEDIIPQIKNKDFLIYYPYESIEPFLRLLKEAATDEKVISVQITIYRLSMCSDIIKYLIEARENGKDITVLIELRARFDEALNIYYANLLEEAGCNILYGFENYKVHSKVCLITRKENNNILHITQIGTGNYNETTSKLYTDFCFITSNPVIGKDAFLFFKNMSNSILNGKYKRLLVAPLGIKSKLMEKINIEIDNAINNLPTSIIIQTNSLTDRDLIGMLNKASNAGVKIKLIVRGICCLIPGLLGKTENIEIISIVGRFLEHSRIYCFGTGKHISIYLSSADLMTRNSEKRVEIAVPIEDPILKKKILHILDIMLNNNVKARKVNVKGDYEEVTKGINLIDSQNYFMNQDFDLI